MEQMLHKHYEISSTIKHRGERGRQREDGLAQFLRENLPEAYGVATGELIASEGDLNSPQCDIIIYDKLHTPIIGKSSPVQQVPIEGVFAIIEVKSILDSSSLKDAKRKFEQIDAMEKCEPITLLKQGKRRGPHYYLFGYNLKTTPQACMDLVKGSNLWEYISIFALDKGGIVWVPEKEDFFEEPDSYLRPIWVNATVNKQQERSIYHTLGLFFIDLLTNLQKIDLGKVNFLNLIGLRYSPEEDI